MKGEVKPRRAAPPNKARPQASRHKAPFGAAEGGGCSRVNWPGTANLGEANRGRFVEPARRGTRQPRESPLNLRFSGDGGSRGALLCFVSCRTTRNEGARRGASRQRCRDRATHNPNDRRAPHRSGVSRFGFASGRPTRALEFPFDATTTATFCRFAITGDCITLAPWRSPNYPRAG
jgi:hypothetical protein